MSSASAVSFRAIISGRIPKPPANVSVWSGVPWVSYLRERKQAIESVRTDMSLKKIVCESRRIHEDLYDKIIRR